MTVRCRLTLPHNFEVARRERGRDSRSALCNISEHPRCGARGPCGAVPRIALLCSASSGHPAINQQGIKMRIRYWTGAGLALALAFTSQSSLAAPSKLEAAAASDTVQFSVYLPLRNQAELDALLVQLHDTNSPKYQHGLTPAEFMARFGPSAGELAAAKADLIAHGFSIVSSNAHGMRVSGPAAAVGKVLNISLFKQTSNGHQHFVAKGTPQLTSQD